MMSRGNCYLEVEGLESPISVVGGDLVMLPHGTAHTLRDRLESSAVPAEELQKDHETARNGVPRHDGGGEVSAVVSGYFMFESRATNFFFATLPELIHICFEEGHTVPWLDETLKFLAAELASEVPGAQIIMTRLADVLLIQILRAFIARKVKVGESCDRHAGVLRALADPQIGKAIALIHQKPAHPWTVAELASEVGLSRTGFAVRFTKMAGIAPLEYVRKWRMLKASDLLRQGKDNVEEIAIRIGYESGAAFSQAFKREIGLAPGLYRKASAPVDAM
jgi:AraC-like DNA-binding protein